MIALLLATTPAQASSEGAWREFRADVLKSCRKAVADKLENPAIAVDPFGSETYGVAIAKGVSKDAKARRAIDCIYDKKTKTIEASGEFTP